MTLLATTTLTGGSVTVSSLTGYKELYFVFKDVYFAADSYIECRFNGDSGSNYGYQFIQFTGATIASNGGGNAAGTGLVGFVGNTSTNTALFQGSMRVAAVDQTNGVSWFATNSYYDTTNNATLAIGRYKNSAVISSATFYAGSSTYSGGTLLTYGVK